MPRIRCRYVDCIYLEAGLCGADQIDLDPELGCLTFAQEEEELAIEKEEEWEEEPASDEGEDEDWDEDELEEDLDEDDFEDDEDEDW